MIASRNRLEALCRTLMAMSGLAALQLDPPDFSIAPQATVPMLLGYLAFAVWFLVGAWRGKTAPRGIAWADVAWGLALTAVSGGTSSVLFFFLLLPIMSRAFRDGFRAGWTAALVTTGGFLLVGLPTSPGGIMFEFNRAMIRPLTLLILGYMIAREGGVQQRARRRLALLADLNTVANPRFGAERTLRNAADRIRRSYAVRECLVVLRRGDDGDCLVVRSTMERSAAETLPLAAVSALLALPDDACVLFAPRRFLVRGVPDDGLADRCQGLCDVLDTTALLTVPLGRGGRAGGRIFVMDGELARFDTSELEFLADAGAHLHHIVEKLDLLDRLASLAAARERRRLAHDLHDLAIQPYLGLLVGLEAALRRPGCSAAVADDLRGLLRLAHQGVDELRRLLAGQNPMDGKDMLPDSLARVAEQYRDQFGIEVDFACDAGLQVSDRLAADLLAMMNEGLSNVRRHTASRWVRLQLGVDSEAIELSIANQAGAGEEAAFMPKSIRARAAELGGEVSVDLSAAGETRVCVRIPL